MTEVLKNFWVLEGLDGSGTTTQLRNLEKKLKESGNNHFITQEPTTLETGKLIRRILSGELVATQSTIAYLFAADRDNHLHNPENGILRQLKEGKIVISDRYFFSSLAYQSIGFDYSRVEELNNKFPYPEYLIYIDTPAEDCLKRIDARGQDKEIFEKLEFQKQVRTNYENCFKKLPEGCNLIKIDGTLSKEEIFSLILKQLPL